MKRLEIAIYFMQEISCKMKTIVIDLSNKQLNESWLRMFGYGISSILQAMFGDTKIPVQIKGSKSDIKNFAKVLAKEKGYMDAYRKFGLDNPRTYKSRFKLNKAIKDFEKRTGIVYPLK